MFGGIGGLGLGALPTLTPTPTQSGLMAALQEPLWAGPSSWVAGVRSGVSCGGDSFHVTCAVC